MKKAQISFEFIMYVGFLLIVVAIAASVAIVASNSISTENTNLEAKSITELVAIEINIAKEVGNGYSHEFFLPNTIRGNINYTVNITNQRVYTFWNIRSHSLPILADSITGSPHNGTNIIRNIEGVVDIA